MELLEAVIGGLPVTVFRTGVICGPAYNGGHLLWARWPGMQLRLAAGNTPNIKDEDLHCRKTTYRPLQITFQCTQARSWAPSGPVRIQRAAELRTRHRA